jgi:hypothetical protein
LLEEKQVAEEELKECQERLRRSRGQFVEVQQLSAYQQRTLGEIQMVCGISLFVRLFVCLFICLFIYLFIYLFVCL